jgi:hypothetical protein
VRPVAIIVILGLLATIANGGRLDDFEEKGKKKKKPKSSFSETSSQSSRHDVSSNSSSGSGTSPSSRGSSFGDLLTALVLSLFQYRHDDPAVSTLSGSNGEATGEGWADGRGLYLGHTLGAATMPYVRADYNWQYIDSNLDAEDLRIEAGYKPLAFYGRHTVYTESNPTDELTLNQYYGMLRFGGALQHEDFPSGSWDVGLGLGAAVQEGNDEHSSWAFTLPVKLYPTDWFGVEFRPAWYRPQDRVIGDYDLSASLGWRYVQLRGGYRWLWIQGVGHELNGPYAGVSVSF